MIYIFTKKKRKRNLLFAYLHIEESYRIQTKQTTFREKETSISKNILCTVYFHFSKTDNDVSSLIETRLIRPFRATQVERILSARPTFLRSSTRATKAFLPLSERVEDKFYNVRVLQISPEPVSPLSPAGSSRGINKFRPLDRRGGKWIKSAAKWRREGGRVAIKVLRAWNSRRGSFVKWSFPPGFFPPEQETALRRKRI